MKVAMWYPKDDGSWASSKKKTQTPIRGGGGFFLVLFFSSNFFSGTSEGYIWEKIYVMLPQMREAYEDYVNQFWLNDVVCFSVAYWVSA